MKKYNTIKRNLLKDTQVKKEYNKLSAATAFVGKIIELRLKNKYSQADLAKRLGTKQPGIARLEKGAINPTIAYLELVAKAFNKKLVVEFK
jgi:DNA-binding XRE family transcriptional regulator